MESVKGLKEHYNMVLKKRNLKSFLNDKERNSILRASFTSAPEAFKDYGTTVFLDYTHCKLDRFGHQLLLKVAEEAGLASKIQAQLRGDRVNTVEDLPVLHTALRMSAFDELVVDHVDLVNEVMESRGKVHAFADKIRAGHIRGHSGEGLGNIVVIGSGCAISGIPFVFEAIRGEPGCKKASSGISLRLHSNTGGVPIPLSEDLSSTLFIVISK